MHNKKIIATGLAVGLTISSLPIESLANSLNDYNVIKEERIENSSKDSFF